MAFKKVDREFCLSDDSVNVYGYRMLTSGCQVERYNPPIGFLMHNRERGVAVRWEDLRCEGGKLYGKPCVNETAFPDLAQQIEDGFYAGASCGQNVALEWSDAPDLKLEGQTGPTITSWFPREISIVDLPGNYNALSNLYDEAGSVLMDLSDNRQLNNNNSTQEEMSKTEFTPAHLQLMDLAADAAPEAINLRLQDLVDKAKRTEIAETELKDLKAETTKKEVEAIIEKGLADKRITNELGEKLKKTYADNPEGLKDLISSIPAQTLVTEQQQGGELPEKFKGKTLNDLYVAGTLGELKINFPEHYQKLKGGQ